MDDALDLFCYARYRRGGAPAVYAYIRRWHPEVTWAWCPYCESETPTNPKTGACLVCASIKATTGGVP